MIHWIFTLSRFLIAPFVFMNIRSSDVIALYLLGYAIISDFLDGYFARLLGKTSIIGAIVDGFADKFLIYITLLGLMLKTQIPHIAILTAIWMIRDAILTIFWIVGKNSFQSIYFGKIYTTLQFFTIVALLVIDLLDYKIPTNFMKALIVIFFCLGAVTIRKYYRYLICH